MSTFVLSACFVGQTATCSQAKCRSNEQTVQKCSSSSPCCVSRRKLVQSGIALSATFLPGMAAAKPTEKSFENGFENDRPFFNFKRSFADIMENDMKIYEDRISARKMNLFHNRVPNSATVLDIGIGGGPNLKYLPHNCTVIGLEPNRFMWQYSQEKAKELGLPLKIKDAYAESIPIPAASCDTVISTLTLCSVKSPSTVLDEIGRVLKPGGFFIFVEHIIAPSSEPLLRAAQTLLNPLQNLAADGCNVNRDTEQLIRSKGKAFFDQVAVSHFDAEFGGPLHRISLVRPHISGYARRSQQTA